MKVKRGLRRYPGFDLQRDTGFVAPEIPKAEDLFSCGFVLPHAMGYPVLESIHAGYPDNPLVVVYSRICNLTQDLARILYREFEGDSRFSDLVSNAAIGPSNHFLVYGKGAVHRLKKMAGDRDPKQAREGTLRRKFGVTDVKNAVYVADSPEDAMWKMTLVLGSLREIAESIGDYRDALFRWYVPEAF
jgi:nucleoside-diphosphate kinase